MTQTADFPEFPKPDFPVPAGVIEHDDWLSTCADDTPVRTLLWSRHGANETASTAVCGFQYGDDGRIENEIQIWGRTVAMDNLTAAEARELAAALIEAADAIGRLK